MTRVGLGIDIGGSGVKGALVDLETGEFIGERIRFETPEKSTPKAVAKLCTRIIAELGADPDTPVGITIPAPVVHGTVPFIANLHKSWTGIDAEKVFSKITERSVTLINDADAAGVAEAYYGAAKNVLGTVIVTTQGTGIGSALLYNGVLIPNTELGHLELDGRDAESHAAASRRNRDGLSWRMWAKRLQRYYSHLEMLFSPELLVVGGGVSKRHEQFLPLLHLKTPIVPAELRNTAGIVGAAVYADQQARGERVTALPA